MDDSLNNVIISVALIIIISKETIIRDGHFSRVAEQIHQES